MEQSHTIMKTSISKAKVVTMVFGLLVIVLIVYLVAGVRRSGGNAQGIDIDPPSKWRSGNITTFQVGTYNIHRAKGMDGVQDINRIAKAIRGLNIVSLQEVSGPRYFDAINQAQKLGTLLDIGWLYAPTSFRLGYYSSGTGLLSQHKVIFWRRQQLDSPVNSSYRNFIVAKIQVGNKVVTFINTHIHTGVDRVNQLETVINEFNKYDVAILAGDLNTRRHQSPLRELLGDPKVTDAIKIALGYEPPIWTVDWILTRGLKVIDGKYQSTGASDHPLYSVQLSFLE